MQERLAAAVRAHLGGRRRGITSGLLALWYEGFETASAANGREVLTAAALMCPDLVLLDVMLPDMDGLELYRRLTSTSTANALVVPDRPPRHR